MKALLDRLRASVWTNVLLRSAWVVSALVALALIGRAAAALPAAGSAGGGTALPVTATLLAAEARDASAEPGAVTGAARAAATTAAGPGAAAATATATATAAATAPATASGSTVPSSARASAESPVFINHASVDELRRLPGVGPKRAEAILALRQRLGRFHRVEDLLRVKGVGRATVKKWRPLVRLDAPPTADAGPP